MTQALLCKRLGLLACIATQISAQPVDPPTQLAPSQKIERQIGGGQSHDYQFTLQAGHYALVVVEQRTVDVGVEVLGPNAKPLVALNNFLTGSNEIAEVIAEVSGPHLVRVSSRLATALPGSYTVELREVLPATDRLRARAAGCRTFAKAITLWRQSSRESKLQALDYLEQSMAHWHTAEDQAYEAAVLHNIGALHIDLADHKKALDYTTRAVALAQASGDRKIEAWARYFLTQVHNHFGDKRKALESGGQTLELMREIGDRGGESDTLNALGTAYLRMGDGRKALEYLEPAGRILREIQDRHRLATLIGNLGVAYGDLGEYSRALDEFQLQLALHRELANPIGEATTLSNAGNIHTALGEYQKALNAYRSALDISRSLNQPWSSAIYLHNLAWTYSTLGDQERALQLYREALEIFREVKDLGGLGNSTNDLAEVHAKLGNHDLALKLHTDALAIRRSIGDLGGEAVTLHNLAKAYARIGEREKARDHFERSLRILRGAASYRKVATALRNLGKLERESQDFARSLQSLNEALEISHGIGDRKGEADALVELARVDRDRGNFEGVHQHADRALALLESLRLAVASPALRASFFALAREVQELNVEALMSLHKKRPGEKLDVAALVASERGRARSLLELLAESGAEIRRGVDPALLDRERKLQQLISGKAEQQVRRLSRKDTKEEAAAARNELDSLAAELEQIQSKIRETSPQYAALVQPAPLDLHEIQSKVLDENTVLLEYALGAEKSYLWAVTRSSAESFELPGREKIESAAKRVHQLVTARNENFAGESPVTRAARLRNAAEAYPAAALEASGILLGPVAGLIHNKRLLIVGEGVLQYLPFAALPEPGRQVPLIVEHEVITAPSASVMAVLRQEAATRRPPNNTLAVLADPVFSSSDARVARPRNRVMIAPASYTVPAAVSRTSNEAAAQQFSRLRFSRSEAEEIARLAPAETRKVLDFDASRETVLSPEFGSHRILHFATHGLLNSQKPELSGVVLSLVDRDGNPQNGFLRLYDIYNLRLSSDLVVLSACQTGLGGEIKGEGLIGLTRGFLYAGAPRVVASMWEVDDRATAELMKHYYRGMLVDGERPAAALRAAQIAMWKTKGWDAPYYWAAFTHLGEWR